MNCRVFEPLLGDNTDQAVEVRRGEALLIRTTTADVELREKPGGTQKFTLAAGATYVLGRSYGQTLYLRTSLGAVIELAAT